MIDISGLDLLHTRFERLRLILWANLSVVAVSFLFEVAELLGLFTFNTDPDAEFGLFEALYFLVGVAMIIVAIATFVLWCMWLHRAAKNVVEADFSDFDYTPAWAVGWHFVPFANLFKPFEIMRKIWNASTGASTVLDAPAPIINRWWVAWLVAGLAGNISGRIALQAESAETLYLGTVLGAISSIATFVAIPTAMLMLQTITQGQSERFR
ncbi:DUF4328 domain-containing protein [Sphingorhabdus sp. IMCC26285]|uniref:DUF4328 domain-containing protein n=1 Tax=Sphingorhabdus profundilacus TaxID=2509718 RepID=A0A6I4M038_9SPHN|nr:DUF4328 domain-containing protein [Sphingorhabdus profundilacus]MVZ97723.1 DUF4328 domain-containing protein [Sphingorhabdus profundilacus]